MSAIYMSQLSTALPLMEGDHHQDHHHHHHQGHSPIVFPFVISNSSASESSLSYGSADHHLLRQHRQAMLEPQHMIGGSSAAIASSVFATPFPTVESIRDDMIEPASYDPYDIGKLQVVGGSMDACSWTPAAAKMRITRKATAADPSGAAGKKPRRRAHQAGYDADMNTSGQPNLGVIRVCSDCNTTETPLWRSGPCGPKSLCNACGIRQRKARRAMMAAASGSGPAVPTDGGKASPSNAAAVAAAAHPKLKKEKRVDVDRSLPFKKRCKVVQVQQDHDAAVAATDRAAVVVQATAAEVGNDDACPSRDLLVDDIGGLISWSRSPAAPASAAAASCSLFRASPALPVQQDEITDAAMLLMTLSCGLVRS
ncbi:protein CYTOKININ-RESPONSIVE GATA TRANSCRIPTION FACTOR 1-like [Miscanthus floridulus]|uniref:protein CYTOKININ-RESPONSIVE GATA TRANSCRIPTION FACTOR 1-like n=1 Tax=Miscanthus floridulus TaxID=154761 RepID=UPI00345745BA